MARSAWRQWAALLATLSLGACSGGGGAGEPASSEKGVEVTPTNEQQPLTDEQQPPAPPVLGGAAKGSSCADLLWSFAYGGEDGFKLERKSAGEFELIATLPASATTYTDARLDPATSYTYRVRAFKNGFDGTESNEITVTTAPRVWKEISATGSLPDGREGHSAILQPEFDRMIVFGGNREYGQAQYLNDVYSLDLETNEWTQIIPSNSGPTPRERHTAVFDPVQKRMMVYGGWGFNPTGSGTWLDDVWALDLSSGDGPFSWTDLSPYGATALENRRNGHSMILDTPNNRLVVYGGNVAGVSYSNSVWSFDLTTNTWSVLIPLDAAAPGRLYHSAVFDGVDRRMIVFGGIGSGGAGFLNDARSLDLDPNSASYLQWTSLAAATQARLFHQAIWDAANRRMTVAGGWVYVGPYEDHIEVLDLDPVLNMWLAIPLSDSIGAPARRARHSMIYDAERQRIVIFGGVLQGSYTGLAEAWVLDI